MARQNAVYDDEGDESHDKPLNAQERANQRWGMDEKKADAVEGDSESLQEKEEGAGKASALDRAKENWGEASFYKGDEEDDKDDSGGKRKFSLRGKINRRNGTITGLIISLITGGFFLNTILSGPLQLLQFGNLIELDHFSDNKQENNDRSARRMYYRLKGQGQRSNLGFVNNQIADRLETKLNKLTGLQSEYAPNGKFIGFKVLDEEKAKAIIGDLKSDQITVTDRNGEKFIDLGDASRLEKKSVIRSFVKGADVDGVAEKVSSRLLIKRAGVDFHPLKNIKRQVGQKIFDYLKSVVADRITRLKEGSVDVTIDGPQADQPKDANGNDLPPNPDATDAVAEADGILGETVPVDLGSQEAVQSLKSKLIAKLGGAAAAVGITCTLRGIGQSAEKLQYTQTILPMIRTGMMYVSVASQIESGQGVNLDELGSLQSNLYDKSEDGSDATKPSSVFSAQPFQSMRGEALTGPDLPTYLRPSKIGEKPLFFQFIDAIPGIDEACSVNDFIGGLPVIKQIGQITGAIVGAVLPIDKLVDGIIGWLAGKGMDYFAKGGKLGAIAMFGGRLAANSQATASGGLAMPKSDEVALQEYNQESTNYDFNHRSILAKTFDLKDPRSAAARLAMDRPTSIGAALTALISSPFKLFSALTPHAAAATSYNYGFPKVGFTVNELNDPSIADPYANAEIVEPQLAALNDKYGKCFNLTVTTEGDTVKINNGDQSFNPNTDENKAIIAACNASTDPMLLRYRAYLADAVGTRAEACYEGVDETACDDLGFGVVTSSPAAVPANNGAVDCSAAVGNDKIVCAGKTLLGVRYANYNAGGTDWNAFWGVTVQGSLGQRPAEWLSQRIIEGNNDFMECSGFTKTAIYVAFGVTVNATCSANYRTDTQYFKLVDFTTIKTGDLLIESDVCGNGGHIGIYLGTTDTGTFSSLESASSNNTSGEKRTGYYERAPSAWKYAVRYIGPGSTP